MKLETVIDYNNSTLADDQSKPTYWLTRFLILRLLGIIYAVAFLVAINQIIPLIGSNGLLPVGIFLSEVKQNYASTGNCFIHLPSLFWFSHSDTSLLSISWIGFILSCIVICGYANAILLAVLWFFYMSIVHVGQEWYGYGWEIQLLETGFLSIFLCPLFDMRPFPKRAPPLQIIILFRWLVFRIMLGAGLIKLRGDEIWQNATALYYHFETQPIPGPFSRWFHFLPRIILKIGVWYNWLAELVAPLFVFGPRMARQIAGCVIIFLQIILLFSGNLSFLNLLTILPAFGCFDDRFWSKILPHRFVILAEAAEKKSIPSRPMKITAWAVTALIFFLSIQPVLNMLSPQQIMNTSFDPLELVNTYGAFGSVGRERLNVVFEGTMDENPNDSSHWVAYPYKGLPTFLDKRPSQVAPYQLRLDWQMWFASMSTPNEYPWTLNLVWKLLHNDAKVINLFADNPFPHKPPRYIRALLYRYSFVNSGNRQNIWWKRERVGDYWLPPMSINNTELIEFLKRNGWVN